jgi:hypothetical protein
MHVLNFSIPREKAQHGLQTELTRAKMKAHRQKQGRET